MILLRVWTSGRTWRELAFVLSGAVLSVPPFALALLGILSLALSVVIFGLALLTGVLALARLTPAYFRAPARRLLGRDWPPPPPLRAATRWRRILEILGDPAAWRALAYCFLRLPVVYAGGYAAAIAIVMGAVSVTYPAWWFLRPDGLGFDDRPWAGTWWPAAQGLAVLLALPWLLRLVVWADGRLVRALLWPSPAARRIADLEAGRAALQQDAAALLRRVERDLHDGTQARLVSLGLALSRIEHRSPDEQIRTIAADARATVTDALAELRDIVRGLHPPALDAGLEVALSTLAARSAVPASVTVDLPRNPPDATASAVYFAAAELLTNIARHAGATRAGIDLRAEGRWLTLTVTDDGRGGAGTASPLEAASPAAAALGASGALGTAGAASASDAVNAAGAAGAGTGLAGLARRAAALDGRLAVDSPVGGPTTVTMTLPRED
ncbi:sensor domain-containing protein [Actinoplanes sp. NPDC049548]|uniref:sensor histidine kinase n=1 Tax=Actinoplanes sp. NPDC049548 TaxID=3155152 RepID=UPI003444E6E4